MNMIGFFNTVEMELQFIEDTDPKVLHGTHAKVGKKDHKVGVLEDVPLKKLYALFVKWERMAEQAILDAKHSEPTERTRLIAHGSKMHAQASAVREIFWNSLKDKFGMWDKASIGIRDGWAVVWSEDRETGRIVRGILTGLPGGALELPPDFLKQFGIGEPDDDEEEE